MSKKSKTTYAYIKNQLVSVQILKERRFLWWTQVLVVYNTAMYDGAIFAYNSSTANWISKNKIIQ